MDEPSPCLSYSSLMSPIPRRIVPLNQKPPCFVRTTHCRNLVQPPHLLTAPDPSASLEPPDSSSSPAAEDTPLNASAVEVSVIIAMPDPHRPSNGHPPAETASEKGKERLSSAGSYCSEQGEGVPDVVVASCRIPIKMTDSNGSPES